MFLIMPALIIHGHFYQPPRENPWTGIVEAQPSAAPFPLCNERDLRTQIRWGLADFRYRFGREAESMWLPETACNDPVMDALIDEGLRYVILAPHQAARVRTTESEDEVSTGSGTDRVDNEVSTGSGSDRVNLSRAKAWSQMNEATLDT